MYFNNILTLATRYIKNIIPVDKDSLNLSIEYIESKDNNQLFSHVNNNLIDIDKNFNTVKSFMYGINSILNLSLILDEWFKGIDLEAINNDRLKFLLKEYNLEQILILEQENYDILQNSLIDLTKDYIKMFSHKPLVKFNEYFISKILT